VIPFLGIPLLAAAPTQVPLWLQVLTLGLAPVLGFVGVAVGALLQGRSAKRAKLRDDRRITYLNFAKTVREFYQWFGLEGTKSADHRAGADLREHLTEIKRMIREIETRGDEVDLIASKDAAAACRKCTLEVIASQAIWMNAVMTRSFDRAMWSKCNFDGSAALHEFRDAAMKDLGVPRKERQRPKIDTPDHAQVEENLSAYRTMFPWLDAAMRAEESLEDGPGAAPDSGSDQRTAAPGAEPASDKTAPPDDLHKSDPGNPLDL
jgi:hypothetical protein